MAVSKDVKSHKVNNLNFRSQRLIGHDNNNKTEKENNREH